MNYPELNTMTEDIIDPPMADPEIKIKGLINLQPSENDADFKVIDKKKHGLSFFLNFLLLVALGFVIFNIVNLEFRTSFYYFSRDAIQASLIALGFIYFFYVIEVFCSSTFRYLWNKKQSDKLLDHLITVKNTRPELQFWCECYHYETRTRWVTETYTEQGPNGPVTRTRQKLETYTVKIVTHTETEYFRYTNFHDASGMISDDINHYDFIKINFKKEYSFGNPHSEMAYRDQYDYFIKRNRYRDSCFDHSMQFQLSNFKDKMLSINTTNRSCSVHVCTYLTWSLVLMMSWPYRIWMEMLCYRGEFVFKKILYV
jgi:hypothetical protein